MSVCGIYVFTWTHPRAYAERKVGTFASLLDILLAEALRIERVRIRIVRRVSVDGVHRCEDQRALLEHHVRVRYAVVLRALSEHQAEWRVLSQRLCNNNYRLVW